MIILVEEELATSDEIPDSCRIADSDCDSSVFDMDESESDAPSSKAGLSRNQVSQDSIIAVGRGRPMKQKKKSVPGPGRGHKRLRK